LSNFFTGLAKYGWRGLWLKKSELRRQPYPAADVDVTSFGWSKQ